MKKIAFLFAVLFAAGLNSSQALDNPVPLINQPLVPDAIAPGGAGFILTVNGTGFASAAVINWNGSARPTTFLNSSKLTATIPDSDIATGSTATITVFNPGPGGGFSNIVFLSITTPTDIPSVKRSEYAAGVSPQDPIAADFNLDGKLDVAIANHVFGSTISILLGNGDGTLQPLVQYSTGTWPESPASDDFNGDGKPDLAVANYIDDDVSVFLGNGNGTFQQQVRYPAGFSPGSIVIADFNRDGKLDLVVANCKCFDPGESTVSVLLGNGDGTFQSQLQYDAGDTPIALGTGDFDKDGKLDLVVANYYIGTVNVLLGNGNGSFQKPTAYPANQTPYGLEIADFNGDSNLDLVVNNDADSAVSILLGNGDGTFQPLYSYLVGPNPKRGAFGDIDADGNLDLVIGSQTDNSVRVLFGNGDGTFGRKTKYAAGGVSRSTVVGDLNGDGKLDLVVGNNSDSKISILLLAACKGLTVYADADGDGYGNAADTLFVGGRQVPEGYVKDSTDCDDTNASIHPLAKEICNGIDDNCNGIIDEISGLATTNITATAATFNWNRLPGSKVYIVQYRLLDSTVTTWSTTGAAAPVISITIPGLRPNSRYVWKIRSVCSGLRTTFSDPVRFKTAAALSAGQENEQSIKIAGTDLAVYPNPTNGNITVSVSLPKPQSVSISVFDVIGKEVYVSNESMVSGTITRQLDLSKLNSGTYFLKLIHYGKTEIKKIVVKK